MILVHMPHRLHILIQHRLLVVLRLLHPLEVVEDVLVVDATTAHLATQLLGQELAVLVQGGRRRYVVRVHVLAAHLRHRFRELVLHKVLAILVDVNPNRANE